MRYSYINYLIETDMPISIIHKLSLRQNLNKHSRLWLSGIMLSSELEIFTERQPQNFTFTLFEQESNVIFCGQADRAEFENTDSNMASFEICAISMTKTLDLQRRSRTFQNLDMTYRDVLDEVIVDYDAHYISHVDIDKKIPHMLIQYEETDWQFLLRLVSHFSSSIVVNAESLKPKLYFGIEGNEAPLKIDASALSFSFEKDFTISDKLHHNVSAEQSLYDGFSYRFKAYTKYELGQRVLFQDTLCVVKSVTLDIDKGQPVYSYHLIHNRYAGLTFKRNEKLNGAKLHGRVKEIHKNTMRVHFDIDTEYKSGNNVFIPYSGEVNNEQGFYLSIPESKIEVFFTDASEDMCIVSAAVRIHEAGEEYISNPKKKHLSNNYGKQWWIDEKGMGLIASKDAVQIYMSKDGQIFVSGEDININTGTTFNIGTQNRTSTDVKWASLSATLPRKIQLSAENGITLSDGVGINAITMNENCEIICDAASRIRTYGEASPYNGTGLLVKEEKEIPTTGYERLKKEPEKDKLKIAIDQENQIDSLTCSVLSLAAVGFIAGAVNPDNQVFEIASEYTQKKAGFSKLDSQQLGIISNPICDKLLGGNESLFQAISYGQNMNKL